MFGFRALNYSLGGGGARDEARISAGIGFFEHLCPAFCFVQPDVCRAAGG